ncbi:hypothetical protein GLYMA_11G106700v4 [Glycine max]|uniref:Uncharacterized protein n=2 Tax=Glycine subgen. Soja TaxID=1462606 RepID=A0A0R0HF41_SOYBN|nr:hypothetical protein GYH30_030659 [Glycine max]KRH29276.1 hypothetical protein GLYMA_11G106700v4 [Glycine max]RZB79324.1 hypothetical protein D0Y65_029568 [Glycine soja]RZB79325.1 hypothetical protein D0Y65_029568 [Glycine soja]
MSPISPFSVIFFEDIYQNFPTASSVEVPSHESGSSNESTDISTPLTHDLGVYNQISSDQNTGSGSCLSTVRPANIHPQVCYCLLGKNRKPNENARNCSRRNKL